MTNDNKTVEQVALSVRPLAEQIRIIRGNYSIGSGEFDALDEAADVVECHQREIGELKGERKGSLKANWSFAYDNTRLREENAKLRALVGELADALEGRLCDFDCEIHGECLADMEREKCESFNLRALVAKARKEVKDVK